MAVSATNVMDRVVELDSRFDGYASLSIWAASALRQHDESVWGATQVYIDAMAYWVLHQLTLDSREAALPGSAGALGPVSSIRTGDESVSYQAYGAIASGVQGDVFFFLTTWGRRYIGLRNTREAAHLFII